MKCTPLLMGYKKKLFKGDKQGNTGNAFGV